jgi:mannose-1-phosphate guanylyltransferase/mannose-6-phosphate isomerase
MIIPVILAGGTGSRLWPLSRSAYPKQLLPLISGKTMLQETLLRIQPVAGIQPPIVICNQEHRFLVAEQLKEIGIDNAVIILEPVGRGTAPAVAIAALYLKKQFKEQDPILFILPADHVIQDQPKLIAAIQVAVANAEHNQLVTFGIQPTQPEIAYGYIKANSDFNEYHAHPVIEFVEKPDQETARQYLLSGQYYWNSGMFMFKSSSFLNECASYAPDILQACETTVATIVKDLDFVRLDTALFSNCRNDSIDYAVMEHTQNAVLVPLNAAWSDVGSWASLWETQVADEHGNVLQGDVFVEQVHNSYLRAESRMLAVVGVSDHIVVETQDAVLVAHKDNSQAVKKMVETLKKYQRTETDMHRKVYRPWGSYETVDKSEFFQVKRITVKPGARLSLQLHHHRSEHWIVVSGIAEVTRGDDVFAIRANESTYIPQGVKHRLTNHGSVNLELIEVQSGTYLGEDDIVRFEDVYGRVTDEVSSQQ